MTLAFIVATCWATAGCLAARTFQQASYVRLAAFWAMSAFGFTFANELVLFPLIGLPHAVLVGAVAGVAVLMANRGFEGSDPLAEPARWEKLVFAGMLIAAGTAGSFSTGSAIREYIERSDASAFPPAAGVAIVASAMFPALVGAMLLLWRQRASEGGAVPPDP